MGIFSELSGRQGFLVEFGRSHRFFQIKDVFDAYHERFGVERLTLVRDLAQLTARGVLERTGKGRAVSYHISGKYLFHENVDIDRYFSLPFNERNAKPEFQRDVFQLFETGIFSDDERKRLETIDVAYRSAKRKLERESPTILRREWERLVVELSWKSSEIEGNTYTLLETEALLKERQRAEGKDVAETQMILNHKKALDFILGHKDEFREITVEKVLDLHALLTEDMAISVDFRNHPVGITGTLYRPLARYDDIAESMRQLSDACARIGDAFGKAFFLLTMISYIQPFEDGNKRTARILADAVLYAYDHPMLSYRNVSAIDYKKAIVLFYERNNISLIKNIFLDQIVFSAKNYFEG